MQKFIAIQFGGVLAAVLFGVSAFAEVTTFCCTEAARDQYIATLTALPIPVDIEVEGFESGPWADISASPLQSVERLGITWSRLDAGLRRSAGGGNIIDGEYLMFSFDSSTGGHAVPDGFSVSTAGFTLYGMGGWYRGSGAKLAFEVDGDPDLVDFTGEEATVISWKFLAFIDDTGFEQVNVAAADETGGETNIYFTDAVTLAAEQNGFAPSDDDGDTVADNIDNCTLVSNASQTDTDNDAIGNHCDPDFDQNCTVNFTDISQFADAFLGADPLYDLNDDGGVNFLDFLILSSSFLLVPGPSGLPNACAAD